jgi:hypothetical protein
MLLNLQTAGRSPSFSAPTPAAPAEAVEPSPWAKRLDAYSNVPEPIDDRIEAVDEDVPESPEPVTTEHEEPEPTVAETAEDEAIEADSAAPEDTGHPETDPADVESVLDLGQPAPLRPGPGLIPRQVVRPGVATTSPSPDPPDWETAWEEPPAHEEPYEDVPLDAAYVFADEEPVEDDAAIGEEETKARIEQPEAIVEDSPSVTTDEEIEAHEVVLDLEHLEVEPSAPAPAPPAEPETAFEEMVEPDLELLFAGASGPEGERSGLFGAVRSAFARNRGGAHEHQFVEAPGGIGIVRQICAECGYISIGVAD